MPLLSPNSAIRAGTAVPLHGTLASTADGWLRVIAGALLTTAATSPAVWSQTSSSFPIPRPVVTVAPAPTAAAAASPVSTAVSPGFPRPTAISPHPTWSPAELPVIAPHPRSMPTASPAPDFEFLALFEAARHLDAAGQTLLAQHVRQLAIAQRPPTGAPVATTPALPFPVIAVWPEPIAAPIHRTVDRSSSPVGGGVPSQAHAAAGTAVVVASPAANRWSVPTGPGSGSPTPEPAALAETVAELRLALERLQSQVDQVHSPGPPNAAGRATLAPLQPSLPPGELQHRSPATEHPELTGRATLRPPRELLPPAPAPLATTSDIVPGPTRAQRAAPAVVAMNADASSETAASAAKIRLHCRAERWEVDASLARHQQVDWARRFQAASLQPAPTTGTSAARAAIEPSEAANEARSDSAQPPLQPGVTWVLPTRSWLALRHELSDRNLLQLIAQKQDRITQGQPWRFTLGERLARTTTTVAARDAVTNPPTQTPTTDESSTPSVTDGGSTGIVHAVPNARVWQALELCCTLPAPALADQRWSGTLDLLAPVRVASAELALTGGRVDAAGRGLIPAMVQSLDVELAPDVTTIVWLPLQDETITLIVLAAQPVEESTDEGLQPVSARRPVEKDAEQPGRSRLPTADAQPAPAESPTDRAGPGASSTGHSVLAEPSADAPTRARGETTAVGAPRPGWIARTPLPQPQRLESGPWNGPTAEALVLPEHDPLDELSTVRPPTADEAGHTSQRDAAAAKSDGRVTIQPLPPAPAGIIPQRSPRTWSGPPPTLKPLQAQ